MGTWADIAGLPADGSDLGRTHASSLWIAYDLADRVMLRFDASSQLFTRSLTVDRPQLGMTIPIVFREIDRFRLGVGLGAPGAAWRVRLGFAVEVFNHEHLTAGATGQQRAWHDLAFGEFHSGWDMRHQSDGRGVFAGVSADARFGARERVVLTEWLRLDARGFAGLQLHTFFAGSALLAEGRIALTFGSPREVRFVVALAQDAYAWLASPGIMVRSTIELRLDLRFAALCVELHRYDGDQNEGYYAYVFPNTTMTVSLLGRF